MMMRGHSAGKRRLSRHKESKDRLEDGRSTHFVVGYTPYDFASETKMKFRGDPKSDKEIPAAGSYAVLTYFSAINYINKRTTTI